MYQLRLFKLLLEPSLLSGLGSLVAACVMVIVPNMAYLQTQSFVYDIFYGPHGLATTLQNAQGSVEGIGAALSETPFTYLFGMFVLSVLAGAITFAVLQGLHRLFVDVAEPVKEVRIAGSSRSSVEKEIGIRVGLRIISFAAWCIYWFATVKILWPFCVLTFGAGLLEFTTLQGLSAIALSVGLMTIGLHLHIVFLRLTLLKPRAFGGERSIERTLY